MKAGECVAGAKQEVEQQTIACTIFMCLILLKWSSGSTMVEFSKLSKVLSSEFSEDGLLGLSPKTKMEKTLKQREGAKGEKEFKVEMETIEIESLS
nr:hypothetical protein [Tanacetum cinerariifolium]